MHTVEFIRHTLEVILYLGQAGIYAFAFKTSRKGAHAPAQVYLASSIVHMSLAAELMLP